MDSQLEQIRRHLLTRGSITKLEGLREYGCMNTGGRVYELRRAGMAIETRVPPEGKRYAVYTYTGPQQITLSFPVRQAGAPTKAPSYCMALQEHPDYKRMEAV